MTTPESVVLRIDVPDHSVIFEPGVLVIHWHSPIDYITRIQTKSIDAFLLGLNRFGVQVRGNVYDFTYEGDSRLPEFTELASEIEAKVR